MPVFAERESQLKTLIDDEKTLDAVMKTALQNKVREVKSINSDLNAQLARLIATPTQFADKTAFGAAWNSAVDQALSRLSSTFNTAIPDRPLPDQFRIHWMQRVYVQECVAISSAKIEGWRDQLFFMCAFEVSMTKLIVEMRDKWNGFINQKNILTDTETQAIAVVTKSLESAIEDSRRMSQSLVTRGENLTKDVSEGRLKFLSKVLGIVTSKTVVARITESLIVAFTAYFGGASAAIVAASGAAIKEGLQVAVSSIVNNGRTLNAATDRFRDCTIKAGYPIGMFNKNKELVLSYRSEADLKKLESANDSALKGLASRKDYFEKCQFPPSMTKDHDTFAAEMMKSFNAVRDRCVQIDKDFRAEFHGIFEGATLDTTIERLTGVQMLTGLVADTAARVDHREPGREAQKLLPAIEAIWVGAANAVTDTAGLPEEVRVLMLADTPGFRQGLSAHFAEMKRNADEAAIAARKLEEARDEALKKLDRKALSEGVKK